MSRAGSSKRIARLHVCATGSRFRPRPGCVKGRRMATVAKCKFDLEVCGGIFVNEPCVIDGNLVSGRTFHDHGKYMGAWMKLLDPRAAEIDGRHAVTRRKGATMAISRRGRREFLRTAAAAMTAPLAPYPHPRRGVESRSREVTQRPPTNRGYRHALSRGRDRREGEGTWRFGGLL